MDAHIFSDIWSLKMSIKYGGSNVSKILRVTMSFSVSSKLITHIHFYSALLR